MLDSERIKELAAEVGFDLCGITTASIIPKAKAAYLDWLEKGYHAEMSYLANDPDRRTDPSAVLYGAKSVIMLGLNYYNPDYHITPPAGQGLISKYARGKDYHKLNERKLRALTAMIKSETEPEPKLKWYVDYGPLMERAYAAQAGLGYLGKNGLLINRQFGSWFFLSEIITDLDLTLDDPAETNHGRCGSCTRCVDACPTVAIIADGVVDSARCISYLTIERPSAINEYLASGIRPRLFGCDVCQDVCPHNGRAVQTRHQEFLPDSGVGETVDLEELLATKGEEEFLKLTAGTPLTRPKLAGLKRTARILLGLPEPDPAED